MARCYYCRIQAGFFRKLCPDCKKLVAAVKTLQAGGTFGYNELLDGLLGTGVSPEKITIFLDADPDGGGSLNDAITARMTNELMTALGQPSAMTGEAVKKVREDVASGKSLLEEADVVTHPKAEKEE